jgi:6-pyruvoyltetrahydropterin/6-carboxytetrahydropterin synthase
MYYATVSHWFSAAHNLRNYQGKCERIHGHNYKVEVELKSRGVDQVGMVTDFVAVRHELEKIVQRFDHQRLNEISPFDKINPTAENIAKIIFEEMSLKFNSKKVKVHLVTVWETEHAKAGYGPS